jgi:hypothetical protein
MMRAAREVGIVALLNMKLWPTPIAEGTTSWWGSDAGAGLHNFCEKVSHAGVDKLRDNFLSFLHCFN